MENLGLNDFAIHLAQFLSALQHIDTLNGPLPGSHNFYRGGNLLTYDTETRQALVALDGKIDTQAALKVWEEALHSWHGSSVWFHGDISAGNLLVRDGKLHAVIDFGLMGVGDPACDLAIAWTLFKDESREIFKSTLALDQDIWARGRGWALWKVLITAAGLTNSKNSEGLQCWHIIDEIITDHKRSLTLETNPCRNIKYNPTKPSAKFVETKDLDYALAEARVRGGSYLILALCFYAAYLTASRPEEMRTLTRQCIKKEGLEISIGKRRATQLSKSKMIKWSPRLKATIDEALRLQRTSSVLIFGNTAGQQYTRSGWTTIWTRLMVYCEMKAKAEGISFERFNLSHMRPKAVTTRKERGDVNIKDATGHSSERMIDKTYDRRVIKKSESTE